MVVRVPVIRGELTRQQCLVGSRYKPQLKRHRLAEGCEFLVDGGSATFSLAEFGGPLLTSYAFTPRVVQQSIAVLHAR